MLTIEKLLKKRRKISVSKMPRTHKRNWITGRQLRTKSSKTTLKRRQKRSLLTSMVRRILFSSNKLPLLMTAVLVFNIF